MFRQLWIMYSKSREYARNEKLSFEQFELAKLDKFRRLVRHAAARSPYYADLIREHRIDVEQCVPAQFPVLTKTHLLTHFDRIATDPRITRAAVTDFLTRSSDPGELLLDEFQVIHTSGSSGQVGYFVFSSDDWLRGMMQRLRMKPAKSTPGKLKAMFYGAAGGHYGGVSMASFGKWGVNRLMVDVEYCEINTPLPEVIAKLNAFQPDLIAGYATALKMLARKQQEGALRIAPLRVETGGEAITEADRVYLKSIFRCDVYNIYACSEHLMMGVSLPGSAEMTLYDDDLIYECHDDHLIVTNLFNFTLPLIRYRMSDMLRPLPRKAGAAPYLVVDNLVGRTEMTPTFVNRDGSEDFISPHTINEIFVGGVARFQLRLRSKTHFEFHVCLEPVAGVTSAEIVRNVEIRLKDILAQKRMSNVTFEIVVVDDLPLNRMTRKFQLIVDETRADPSGGSVALS